MQIPVKTTGSFSLPTLGLGTWQMGGRFERDFANDDIRDIAGIQQAIEQGITHIDTAEMYSHGHAEELVGQAIKKYDREKLFITSKVMGKHLRHDDVIKSCQESLARLRLSYLDLYLIHYPNPEIPLSETMPALDELYENGLIRNIGVSNFTPPELEDALSHTKYKIVSNQIYYNLLIRGHDTRGTLEFCQKYDILVTAYRPLEKGRFNKHEMLVTLGNKYSKTPLQIALNWVISQPNMVSLIKTSDPKHLEEDLGALGWSLSEEDSKLLDTKFPHVDKYLID